MKIDQNKILINTLLWSGAVLSIVGLWWPNWIIALTVESRPLFGLPVFKTPLISYIGYILLWAACILVVGLRGSAGNFQAPGWIGMVSVLLVVISSVIAVIGVTSPIVLLLFTLGTFMATLFIYWTMAKLTEIKHIIKNSILIINFISFLVGLTAILVIRWSPLTTITLTYTMVAIYTIAWLTIALSVIPSHYQYMIDGRRNHR